MIDKDPTAYSWLTYLWVTGLAAWGGFVSFYRKVKAGDAEAFNFLELIGELVTSAFAGLITFWLCEAAQIQPLVTAALVGVSGHMGSRAIYQLEHFAKTKFGVHHDHHK
ncbi:MAG: phage holin family protein [Thiobacillus sp.]|nr:phage holin family protein [Thiobacillus sp.]